jgi:hypothetical protein
MPKLYAIVAIGPLNQNFLRLLSYTLRKRDGRTLSPVQRAFTYSPLAQTFANRRLTRLDLSDNYTVNTKFPYSEIELLNNASCRQAVTPREVQHGPQRLSEALIHNNDFSFRPAALN